MGGGGPVGAAEAGSGLAAQDGWVHGAHAQAVHVRLDRTCDSKNVSRSLVT